MHVLVCVVPVCPIRAEPSHRSEQVTQLLFGEKCQLLETTKDFLRVKLLFDNYEGWCQVNQLEEVLEEELAENELPATARMLAPGWINEIKVNGQLMQIPFGSTLPIADGGDVQLGKFKVEYNGEAIRPEKNTLTEDLVKKFSFTFLNTPYLWGGRSVFGVDCSGFTQMVFNCMNIPLLRDAYQQATQGYAIGFIQEAKCGDLAFFDNEAGRITHVGILLSADTIIHASGKVRVDTIDNFGIVSSDTGKRTHNLRVIKRLTE